jgi:hypothetical protein
MNWKPTMVLLSGLLFACQQMPPPGPAPAPAPPAPAPAPTPTTNITPGVDRYVRILRARCGTFLSLSADDRGAASMFYIGYSARRFGAATINVGLIPSIEGLAVDLCSGEPYRTVASAFASAYLQRRRW